MLKYYVCYMFSCFYMEYIANEKTVSVTIFTEVTMQAGTVRIIPCTSVGIPHHHTVLDKMIRALPCRQPVFIRQRHS